MMEHDRPAPDDPPATPEEEVAAAALAAALDGAGDPGGALEERRVVGLIRASGGSAAPLGDLAARSLARLAGSEAEARAAARSMAAARQGPWRWRRLGVAGVALTLFGSALAATWIAARPDEIPARLRSRSAGLLVPGPFPAGQSASARLDLVAADRLVAFRELRARGRAPGAW